MQQAQRRRPEISQSLSSPERYPEWDHTAAATPSLSRISDPIMNPIASSYPNGTSNPCSTRDSAELPMYLKPAHWLINHRCDNVDEYEPVRHSANLNPSVAAMASIILELTVDATMQSLSTPFCGRNGCILALQSRGEKSESRPT